MQSTKTGISYRQILWLGVFAAAMGLLEAIVVVYLRELYYPAGFTFPLMPLPQKILFTEILREVCTILMLVSVAVAAGGNFYSRLSYFLFTFGVWDILYYAGLKRFLDWPPSLLTWDVLFLIPVTWTGPVLAPIISALTMVLLSLFIVRLLRTYGTVKTGPAVWSLMTLGVSVIVLSFIWDYLRIIIKGGFLKDFFGLAKNPEFQVIISRYVPEHYNWWLFAGGEVLIICASGLIYRRTRKRVQIPRR